ncbi:hypothetical protein HBH50_153570 [Parastagonospora nodorum]|nr:hypothetical protein HBH50_153570 [Parastagonospora nodorum]
MLIPLRAALKKYKYKLALALTAIAIVSASSSLALSTALISFSTLFKHKGNAATLMLLELVRGSYSITNIKRSLSYSILSLKKTCSASKKVFNKKDLE